MKSVTTILKRVFPMSESIPKHILEQARERGSKVHEWIEQYNKYLLEGGDEPIIALEYLIYADYYKKWVKDYEVVPIHSELKLVSEEDDIVGIIDLVCKTKDDEEVLVDYKITNLLNTPYVELQTSAYKRMLVKSNITSEKIKQRVLHITKMGYNYIPLNYEWEKFKSIQELDKYLDERK